MNMSRRKAITIGLSAVMATCQVRTALGTATQPKVVVHKNSWCKCCEAWIDHLQGAGFEVEAIDAENLAAVKDRLRVPQGKRACHTGEVENYFVEGHVPAEDLKRLLRERPAARGLTVPDMPQGSPGMETPGGNVDAYDVLLVSEDGSTSVYAHYTARNAG